MNATDREHFSASSLRSLMTCGLKWKLERLDDGAGQSQSSSG